MSSSEGKVESVAGSRDVEKERYQHQTEKMFNKIKRGRLGGADPRAFLEEEAKRLDNATISTDRKEKDRSVLFDEKISEFMLTTLQNHQITRTSDGQASLSDSLSWSQNSGVGGSLNVTTIHAQTVPFDEFYQMFREYSTKNMHQADDDEKDAKSESVAEEKHQKPQVVVAPVIPTDIVHQLAEEDSKFGAYLKLNNKEKLKGSNLLNSGSTIKLRKVRTIAPLGKSAILLLDSKGHVKKLSSQGFKNYFVDPTTEEDGSSTRSHIEEEEEEGNKGVDDLDFLLTSSTDELSGMELAGSMSHGGVPFDHTFGEGDAAATGIKSPPRSPNSRFGRSRARSRRRTASADGVGGEDVPEIQNKLTSSWELMQVPMIARLAFLRKYSIPGHASDLEGASNLLAQISILATCRKEILKYRKKLQQKCISFPLHDHTVIQSISRRLPGSFLDLSSIFSLIAEKIKTLYSQIYEDAQFEDAAAEEQAAATLFNGMLEWATDSLLDKIEYAHSHYMDIVPYGNGTLREWLEKSDKDNSNSNSSMMMING